MDQWMETKAERLRKDDDRLRNLEWDLHWWESDIAWREEALKWDNSDVAKVNTENEEKITNLERECEQLRRATKTKDEEMRWLLDWNDNQLEDLNKQRHQEQLDIVKWEQALKAEVDKMTEKMNSNKDVYEAKIDSLVTQNK